MQNPHTTNWLKRAIHFWCIFVSNLLGIKSYLLGDREQLAHEEHLRHGIGVGFQPYTRPTNFALRLITLLILVALSVVLISMLSIIILVWMGILTVPLKPSNIPTTMEPSQSPNIFKLDISDFELKIIIGLLLPTLCFMVLQWLQGQNLMMFLLDFIREVWFLMFLIIILIPFLIGLLHELVIVFFFQVPLFKTPVILPSLQVWEIGIIMYMPTLSIILLMWHARTVHDALGDELHIDPNLLMKNFIVPIIETLSLYLAVPYVMAYSIVPMVINGQSVRLYIARRIYPTVVPMMAIAFNKQVLVRQFIRFYETIKNEKYLVGRRLENYNHASSVSDQNE